MCFCPRHLFRITFGNVFPFYSPPAHAQGLSDCFVIELFVQSNDLLGIQMFKAQFYLFIERVIKNSKIFVENKNLNDAAGYFAFYRL